MRSDETGNTRGSHTGFLVRQSGWFPCLSPGPWNFRPTRRRTQQGQEISFLPPCENLNRYTPRTYSNTVTQISSLLIALRSQKATSVRLTSAGYFEESSEGTKIPSIPPTTGMRVAEAYVLLGRPNKRRQTRLKMRRPREQHCSQAH